MSNSDIETVTWYFGRGSMSWGHRILMSSGHWNTISSGHWFMSNSDIETVTWYFGHGSMSWGHRNLISWGHRNPMSSGHRSTTKIPRTLLPLIFIVVKREIVCWEFIILRRGLSMAIHDVIRGIMVGYRCPQDIRFRCPQEIRFRSPQDIRFPRSTFLLK